jgi:signal transduction histidine kinase/CheY-like chemotaxis protein
MSILQRPLQDLQKFITIYIVDDNEYFRTSIIKHLSYLGYENIWEAPSCEQALADPNLDLTDILLTDQIIIGEKMTGLELTEIVKKRYKDKIEIILFSGLEDLDENVATSKGARTFIKKNADGFLQITFLKLWLEELSMRIWLQRILDELPDEISVINFDIKRNKRGRILYVNNTKKINWQNKNDKNKSKILHNRNIYDNIIGEKCTEKYGTGIIDKNTGLCLNCPSYRAQKEQRSIRTEWSYRPRFDNTEYTDDFIAKPLFDRLGIVRAVSESCRDITNKKIIEKYIDQIAKEHDWNKRLDIFLYGFRELGFRRARLYLIDKKKNINSNIFFKCIAQFGMYNNFEIKGYDYYSEKRADLELLLKKKKPLIFKIDYDNKDRHCEKDKNLDYLYHIGYNYVQNLTGIQKEKFWIDVPITANGSIIGTVTVDIGDIHNTNELKEKHSHYDLELLMNFSANAGQAIENARYSSLLLLREKTEKAIVDIAKNITAEHDPEVILKKAVKDVCEVMDVCSCSIFIYEEPENILRRTTTFIRNYKGQPIKNRKVLDEKFSPGQTIDGIVFEKGEPEYFNNIQEIATFEREEKNTPMIPKITVKYYSELIEDQLKTAIIAPLIVKGNKIGIVRALQKLRTDHFGGRDFNDDDLIAFKALASVIAVAINNSKILDKLKKAEKTNTDLMRTYSHSLKNRLQSQMAIADRLIDGKDDASSRYHMYCEVKMINAMIDSMQLLTRKELGIAIKPVFLPKNLKDVIVYACNICDIYTYDKNIKLIFDISDELVEKEFFINEIMITDALINLIDNAIKYSFCNIDIKLEAQIEDEYIVLAISNPGPAIEPCLHEKIFESYSSYKTKTYSMEGTGIGLAYVRIVAEAHKGSASIDPDYKNGTRIILKVHKQLHKEKRK